MQLVCTAKGSSSKIKNRLPFDSAILLVGVHAKELKAGSQRDISTMDARINKIHKGISFHLRKDRDSDTCYNPEDIMGNGISHKETNAVWVPFHGDGGWARLHTWVSAVSLGCTLQCV